MPKLPNGQRFHWFELDEKTIECIQEALDLMNKGEKLKGPDELRRVLGPLGSLKPSIQIMKRGEHLEAHAIWPEIFDGLEQDDGKFYMAVPYDYKSEHFVPANAAPLDKQTQKNMEQRVGAAWGQKVACLYHRPPMPVEVPEDFDETKHDFAEGCSVCSTNFALPMPGVKKPKGP